MDEFPSSAAPVDDRVPIPRYPGWLLGLLLAVALPLLVTACGGSSATIPTTSTGSIPLGWNTLDYGKVKISVPRSWSVFRNAVCPSSTAANALYLGAPNGNCPYVPGQVTPTNSVIVSLVASPISYTSGTCPPSVKIDGLVAVVVGPCATNAAAGVIEWWVSSVGVLIDARGPVTDRVLHTLRRA